jgi:hypothetical protein
VDGKLHGEWSSELGTGGVLSLERFIMPSQLTGTYPEQAATTPTRVYNSNRDVGAVRLGREDLTQLIDVVQRDFAVGRAVVSYTPKGGSPRTEYASTLLADQSITGSLESLSLNVQEAEPNGINRGVTVDLGTENDSSVRTYGSVESWVVGKAATVANEISRHEKGLVTGWKRWGLDFNGIIFLFALAFLPVESGWIRLGYLLGAILIILVLKYVHSRAIPMTVIQLGPVRPGIWSRIGAPAFSWILAIASAVAIKVLSDLLSGSSLITQIVGWLFHSIGIEATQE